MGVARNSVYKVQALVALVRAILDDSACSTGGTATTGYIARVPVAESGYDAMDRTRTQSAGLHLVKRSTCHSSVESSSDLMTLSASHATSTTASGALRPSAELADDTVNRASLCVAYFQLFSHGACETAKLRLGGNFA